MYVDDLLLFGPDLNDLETIQTSSRNGSKWPIWVNFLTI
jgi:hypothetical protein